MDDDLIGYTWLTQQFGLRTAPLSHQSYIGSRPRIVPLLAPLPSGGVAEYFQPSYHPGPKPLAHVEFALKYEDLNLDLLRQLFGRLPAAEVTAHIAAKPSGKYRRQIGFLYEFLTGQELPMPCAVGGNYADLLDPDKYFTAAATKNARWRINDNLLGNPQFCPVMRLTPDIRQAMAQDFSGRLAAFKRTVPPDIFRRAIDYLYLKETKSSYDIEREVPSLDREQRFVAVLKDAGRAGLEVLLSETSLTDLQNLIVEPRYAQAGFRSWQNYVGESPPGRRTIIHYVCPPGQDVAPLMDGLLGCARKSAGLHPVARAAMIAFGFVFIHPFEDGNGRIHRYLIHDFLSRDGLVPEGMILPVSATMLHNQHEYDHALEVFSQPLKAVVRYTLDGEEALTVQNRDEAIGYYRYPDLTRQASYLFQTVERTIDTELVGEILFIRNYDAAKKALRAIVDLPDRRLDLLIKFLHQNNGRLSKAKRGMFPELQDEELRGMEQAFQAAFQPEDGMQEEIGVRQMSGSA